MTTTSNLHNELPIAVRNLVRKYREPLKSLIAQEVLACIGAIGRQPNLEEFQECLGKALDILSGPEPDTKMIAASRAAYHRGEFTDLRDFADELRSNSAVPATSGS